MSPPAEEQLTVVAVSAPLWEGGTYLPVMFSCPLAVGRIASEQQEGLMQSHGFVRSAGIGFRLLTEETDYSRSVFSMSIES